MLLPTTSLKSCLSALRFDLQGRLLASSPEVRALFNLSRNLFFAYKASAEREKLQRLEGRIRLMAEAGDWEEIASIQVGGHIHQQKESPKIPLLRELDDFICWLKTRHNAGDLDTIPWPAAMDRIAASAGPEHRRMALQICITGLARMGATDPNLIAGFMDHLAGVRDQDLPSMTFGPYWKYTLKALLKIPMDERERLCEPHRMGFQTYTDRMLAQFALLRLHTLDTADENRRTQEFAEAIMSTRRPPDRARLNYDPDAEDLYVWRNTLRQPTGMASLALTEWIAQNPPSADAGNVLIRFSTSKMRVEISASQLVRQMRDRSSPRPEEDFIPPAEMI
jgi:hypothetical protein